MNQEGAQLDAIAFQMGPQADELAQGTADVAGQLSINEWNGRKKPQLMVTDFAVSGRQLFDFRGKIIKRNQFLQKQQLIFCLMKKSKIHFRSNR